MSCWEVSDFLSDLYLFAAEPKWCLFLLQLGFTCLSGDWTRSYCLVIGLRLLDFESKVFQAQGPY